MQTNGVERKENDRKESNMEKRKKLWFCSRKRREDKSYNCILIKRKKGLTKVNPSNPEE